MQVGMCQHVVLMTMPGPWFYRQVMSVLLMLIVHVLMFQRFVHMCMFVAFGQAQPDAETAAQPEPAFCKKHLLLLR